VTSIKKAGRNWMDTLDNMLANKESAPNKCWTSADPAMRICGIFRIVWISDRSEFAFHPLLLEGFPPCIEVVVTAIISEFFIEFLHICRQQFGH